MRNGRRVVVAAAAVETIDDVHEDNGCGQAVEFTVLHSTNKYKKATAWSTMSHIHGLWQFGTLART